MGTHSLKNQALHAISNAYRTGYGMAANERRVLRERNGIRTIAVRSSREVITNDTLRFCAFVKENYPQDAKNLKTAAIHIQDWVNTLQEQGLNGKTIHGYVDHLGTVFGVSPGDFNLKTDAQNSKDRQISISEQKARASGRYDDFIALAEATGLRKAEIEKLRHSDFYQKDGYIWVHVEQGKGGKNTEQRIAMDRQDDPFLMKVLEKRTDEKVLLKTQISNNISSHRIRRENAQKNYQYYLAQCQTPEGRKALFKEICDYCNQNYAQKDKARNWRGLKDIQLLKKNGLEDKYRARGTQKKELERLGLDTDYSRLATLAVSIFHLAHWRCDVTIHHYYK